jgi:hypothetical protein
VIPPHLLHDAAATDSSGGCTICPQPEHRQIVDQSLEITIAV